jgi:hypothetical protein
VPTYQYKVVEMSENVIGGKVSGEELETLLNEHGRDGWQLKSVTAVDVKDRGGPGDDKGVLVTFERKWD